MRQFNLPIVPAKAGKPPPQPYAVFSGRKMRPTSLAMGFLLGLFFSSVLDSCSDADDTSKILHIIATAAEQAEEHDVSGILDHTVDAFMAQPGNHDRRSVRSILWWAFRHYGRLTVMYPQPAITVDQDGQTATAEVYFLIVKKERSVPDLKELAKDPQKWLRAVGENADLYRLQLELIQPDHQWKVNAARLAPYAANGF